MGCGGSKSDHEEEVQNSEIKVESITFYRFFYMFLIDSYFFSMFRSDENGNPSQQVDGVFFTTGLGKCIFYST
jgi:hypothetical protein